MMDQTIAPTPLDPPDGGDVASSVTLVVGNAVDPEGDPLSYGSGSIRTPT